MGWTPLQDLRRLRVDRERLEPRRRRGKAHDSLRLPEVSALYGVVPAMALLRATPCEASGSSTAPW